MFKLFRTRERQLIHDGRVACPLRSTDVELDACFACPSLREIQVRHRRPFVHCTGGNGEAPGKGWIF